MRGAPPDGVPPEICPLCGAAGRFTGARLRRGTLKVLVYGCPRKHYWLDPPSDVPQRKGRRKWKEGP